MISTDIVAHFESKIPAAVVTAEQMHAFNRELQNAIESAANDGVRLVLADIKYRANRRFYELHHMGGRG